MVELGRVELVSRGEAISRAREHMSVLGILRSSASRGLRCLVWQRGTTAIESVVMNVLLSLAELVAPGVMYKFCDSSVLERAVMAWRCSDTAGSQGARRAQGAASAEGRARQGHTSVRGPGLTTLI